MPYRPDTDTDSELDLAEERALAEAIESYEEDRKVLAEMSDIAREMIEAIEQYVKARAEHAVAGGQLKPGFDEVASIARLVETIRLNDALDAKLARDLQAHISRSSSKAFQRGRTRRPPGATGFRMTVH